MKFDLLIIPQTEGWLTKVALAHVKKPKFKKMSKLENLNIFSSIDYLTKKLNFYSG